MKVNPPVLLFAIIIGFLGTNYYGGIQSHNASVSSSPQSIVIAIVMGGFVIWFPRLPREDYPERRVGIWNRFWACQIDFIVAICLLIGIYIILILIIEYLATGQWQWSYARDEMKVRDVFGEAGIFLLYFGLYYYFYKHAALGRATPGQYILGYRIVPAEYGVPQFGARVFHGAVALWLSIFTLIFTRKNKTGIYFWDDATNTRAISTR